MIRGALAAVRPAADADAPLLAAWHADPEVGRYRDGETFTADEIRGRLRRVDVDSWIVEADGEPVGFLQSALAEHLLAAGPAELTVDPYLRNEAAVRAWRRAGFREVEEREPDEEHASRWLPMRYRQLR